MKKKILSILTVLAVGILVLSGFGVSAVTSSKAIMDNHPPDAPKITGPTNIPPGTYEFTFNATDPDGDNVSYCIDWDDGTYEEWTDFYPSGEEITRSHAYDFTGDFIIRAIAGDIHGLVGPEGWFWVRIWLSRQMINPIFFQFLERFPILNRFLTLLIK